jgi:hypothetical protein
VGLGRGFHHDLHVLTSSSSVGKARSTSDSRNARALARPRGGPAQPDAEKAAVEGLAHAAADGAETDDADAERVRVRGDSTHRLMRRMVSCGEIAE